MLSGDVATASVLFERLRTRHLKEPGISQQLYTVLSRFGLITPDGRLAAPPAAADGAVPAAAPPGKLWTPDSPSAPAPAAPAAAGEQKSKLWLPGMD